MAERGRPRKGTSRIYAAIDAMKTYGFGEDLVRATVAKLLKEYGVNAGYSFIEGDCYKVLVEAICDAQDEERRQEEINHAEEETLVMHDSVEDDIFDDHAVVSAGPSNGGGIVSAGSETPNSPVQSEKDLEEYIPIPPGGVPPSPPLNAATSAPPPPPRRRKPCYGWISDDEDGEEETEFVFLTPMESPSSGTVIRSPNRGSRWDIRPKDM